MSIFRRWPLLVGTIIFVACEAPKDRLERQISTKLASQSGIFAIAFKNLDTQEEVLIREHEIFHAASTMKTPVMIEVFKQAAEGKFNLSDSVAIKNEFSSIVDGSKFILSQTRDSDTTIYGRVTLKQTVLSLVIDMIIKSSNLATNLIIELVGAPAVTQTMRELGASDIQVLRGVEDLKAFDQGLNNTTTAYDLLVIFEKLSRGEIINLESSRTMVNILMDQQHNSIIPAHLPAGVKVAHKTGSITGVYHDSGIIMLPDGRKYVLVMLSKNVTDGEKATAAMADISRMIYEHVDGDSR